MGRVIAIANQKGGVGKTTTAVNLAASLAAAEKKTLLIDMDPQSNATSGSGVSVEEGAHGIYAVLLGDGGLETMQLPTAIKFLSVVPSTPDLIGFEVEAIDLERREYRLSGALSAVSDRFDYILIDTPPSLGLLTVNALTAADSVLIPLQAEYYALEGLGRLTRTVELIRRSLNPRLTIEGVVLTMFDKRNNLAHEVALEVEKHFGTLLWATRIPRNVRLSEAPSFGKPIILYDIRSVGAQSYLDLAADLLRRDAARLAAEGGKNDREESAWAGPVVSDSADAPAGRGA